MRNKGSRERAEPNVSDIHDSDNEANRWAKPVVVLSPILSEGINSLKPGQEKDDETQKGTHTRFDDGEPAEKKVKTEED